MVMVRSKLTYPARRKALAMGVLPRSRFPHEDQRSRMFDVIRVRLPVFDSSAHTGSLNLRSRTSSSLTILHGRPLEVDRLAGNKHHNPFGKEILVLPDGQWFLDSVVALRLES
jgi:hypothetical protein